MQVWRGWMLVALLGGLGCLRVVSPEAAPSTNPCPDTTRSDVFATLGSAKLDVLIVIDSVGAMRDTMLTLPSKLQPVLQELLNPTTTAGRPLPPPDFHLAVAPTNLAGELLPLDLNRLLARDNCTNAQLATGGANVTDGIANGPGPFLAGVACPNCPRYASRAQCACSGLDGTPVCANLFDLPPMLASITLTPDTVRSAGDPIGTLRAALGAFPVCGADATPTDPPAVNAGFYRPDASLLVVFLAGGDEPNVYSDPDFYRETVESLRRLKGTGRESMVTAVTIGGVCTEGACAIGSRATLSDLTVQAGVSDGVDNPADFCELVQAARNPASCGRTNLGGATTPLDRLGSCRGSDVVQIPASPRLMTLACDLGGVIYNVCSGDWSSVVSRRIGDMLRSGNLTLTLQQPSATQETTSTCSDTTRVCVRASPPGGASVDVPNASFEMVGNSQVQLLSGFPAGTQLVVRYPTSEPQCCAAGCSAGTSCNSLGYCQAQTCSDEVGCAGLNELCDRARGVCVSPGACTLDEHCPAGAMCDCTVGRCVPRPQGLCDR